MQRCFIISRNAPVLSFIRHWQYSRNISCAALYSDILGFDAFQKLKHKPKQHFTFFFLEHPINHGMSFLSKVRLGKRKTTKQEI